MAEQTEGTQNINASAEEIMEIITDFDSYPKWTDFKSAEVLKKDKQGRGSEVRYEMKRLPRRWAHSAVVIQLGPRPWFRSGQRIGSELPVPRMSTRTSACFFSRRPNSRTYPGALRVLA